MAAQIVPLIPSDPIFSECNDDQYRPGVANAITLQPVENDRNIFANAREIADFLSEANDAAEREMPLSDLLSFVYTRLRRLVPFQRMGFAEIDYDADRVSAVWCQADRPVQLKEGYSAELSTSSLRFVAEQNRPRVPK